MAAVTVFGLLWVPKAPRSSALPPYANVVYCNGGILSVPMVGTLDEALSEAWKNGFRRLEHRPVSVATVPFAGSGRRDCRVTVVELDGASALALRWRLMLFPPEGVCSVKPHAVWGVWAFEHPSLPSWSKVRFSVTENLLICAVSADSRDIFRLLDVADGRVASMRVAD